MKPISLFVAASLLIISINIWNEVVREPENQSQETIDAISRVVLETDHRSQPTLSDN